MQFRTLAAALLSGAAIGAMCLSPAQAAQSWSFHQDHVLGTSLDIIAVAMEESVASHAADAARAEIQRLDGVLSGWRGDSELQALNRAASFKASPDLFRVIAASEEWRRATAGAFSARLGDLLNFARTGMDDANVEIGRMAETIADAAVSLDPANGRIERPNGVTFAVDGLAKGYIIDRALEAAAAVPGVQGLMIDIGGDLRCWGRAPTAAGWRIGVAGPCGADNQAPALALNIADKAVATSGVGPRGNTIVVPQTGQAAGAVLVTAVADRAADADALASAFSVMAPADSIALADRLPGVAAHIVWSDGQSYTSRDWSPITVAYTPTRDARVQLAANTGPAWPTGFAVKVDYEVPNLGGGRRPHNPYVTIWVTNEAGDVVRTLLYLAGKRRYIDENYIFWQRFGADHPDIVESVTRPTRPPGRYNLVWDGKDDQGRAVPQGKYILNVEASREHGGHSIQHIDMTLDAAAMTAQAAAQDELGATSVSYGKGP